MRTNSVGTINTHTHNIMMNYAQEILLTRNTSIIIRSISLTSCCQKCLFSDCNFKELALYLQYFVLSEKIQSRILSWLTYPWQPVLKIGESQLPW